MCRKQFTFLYTSLYEHVQYNVAKKVFRKKIFTIIFVAESLKGFSYNIVGPASQMVAQH